MTKWVHVGPGVAALIAVAILLPVWFLNGPNAQELPVLATIVVLVYVVVARQAGLAKAVASRTRELTAANAKLGRDIEVRRSAEQALRESEERFRRIADSAPVMLFVTDTAASVTFLNRSALDFTGLTSNEGLGSGWQQCIHPDDLPVAITTYSMALAEQRPVAQEVRMQRADGRYRWVSITGTPRFTPEGEFLGYVGSAADITEQVEARRSLEERVEERTRETERRRQVAEGLRDMLAVLNSNRSLDEILQEILAQTERLLGADAAALYRPVGKEGLLRIRAARGLDDYYIANVEVPYGQGTVGRAMATRQPVAVPNLSVASEDESLYPMPAKTRVMFKQLASQYGALLAVPLVSRDEAYGGLAIIYRESREFSDEEMDLAMAFANQAALAIENARRSEEAEQRTISLATLYRADEELHRSLRLDDVLEALVEVAAQVLRADKSAVHVWDHEREQLTVAATRGIATETEALMTYRLGEGVVGTVALLRESIALEHVEAETPRMRQAEDREGIKSFLTVPIVIGGDLFGVFTVGYTRQRSFDSADDRLLNALAQRAALAIENARLYEQAQQAAVLEERQRLARDLHDAVTQTLFSASLIAEVIPRLWERNRPEGERRLNELRQLTRGALAEMRTLLLELRPEALSDVDLGDLLRQLADAFTGRARTPITLTVEGQSTLTPDVQIALYRITQEALNNVAKHAGATQVQIRLQCTVDEVALQIQDDGRGFDPSNTPPGHLGMGNMRERAAAVGADLTVTSSLGAGTEISVRVSTPEARILARPAALRLGAEVT